MKRTILSEVLISCIVLTITLSCSKTLKKELIIKIDAETEECYKRLSDSLSIKIISEARKNMNNDDFLVSLTDNIINKGDSVFLELKRMCLVEVCEKYNVTPEQYLFSVQKLDLKNDNSSIKE